jgi:hypothetical protein
MYYSYLSSDTWELEEKKLAALAITAALIADQHLIEYKELIKIN